MLDNLPFQVLNLALIVDNTGTGDDEEGCDAGDCYSRLAALLSLPAVAAVFPSFDFSVLGMKKLRR